MPADLKVTNRKKYEDLVASLRHGNIRPKDVLDGLSISEKAFVGCLSLDLFLMSWKCGTGEGELSDEIANEKFIELLKKHILEHGYFSDNPPRRAKMKTQK